MEFDELREMIRRTTYKPGYQITVDDSPLLGGMKLVVGMTVENVNCRGRDIQVYQAELVDPYRFSRPTEAMYFVRDRLRRLEQHELDEWLMFDGRHCFPPHGGYAPLDIRL